MVDSFDTRQSPKPYQYYTVPQIDLLMVATTIQDDFGHHDYTQWQLQWWRGAQDATASWASGMFYPFLLYSIYLDAMKNGHNSQPQHQHQHLWCLCCTWQVDNNDKLSTSTTVKRWWTGAQDTIASWAPGMFLVLFFYSTNNYLDTMNGHTMASHITNSTTTSSPPPSPLCWHPWACNDKCALALVKINLSTHEMGPDDVFCCLGPSCPSFLDTI